MDDHQPKKAQEFRQRAEGLRQIAATTSVVTIQKLFLDLADQYEKLARILSGANEHQ